MKTTIIPIASGKGGTGKSVFTANIAIALAKLGHSCIVADLDFGGSNLHSYLGLNNDYPGIGDYLKARIGQLEELLVPTDFPNLKFIPGDVQSPLMANIPFVQKVKLIDHLKKLEAEYVLLDLGAGSTFNTLDFFGIAPQGMLITTPEYPAIMNMLTFLKNFIFRIIERNLPLKQQIRLLVREMYKRPYNKAPVSAFYIIEEIAKLDPPAAEQIQQLIERFHPCIIFNRVFYPQQLKLLERAGISMNKKLSLNANYFGLIYEDQTVLRSIQMRVPLLPQFPQCTAAEDITVIAERIQRLWGQSLENTYDNLLQHSQRLYEKRYEPKEQTP